MMQVHVADKGQGSLTAGDSFDVLASKFVDTSVYNITNMVNLNRDQEYKQVVLVGDGMCTRFARIPWPAGTVIYLVAPGMAFVDSIFEMIDVQSRITLYMYCIFCRTCP